MGYEGGSLPPKNSTTSDFDEIYTIYVNFPENRNGNAPEYMGGHVGGLGGAAAPFQVLKKISLAV